MLSISIPTLNEKENLEPLITRIFSAFAGAGIGTDQLEVIIVDDNSRDGTPELVESLKNKYPLRLIRRPQKLGLSSAVLSGFRAARFNHLACLDADLSHAPEILPAMLAELKNPGTDLVIGSRYVTGGGIAGWPWSRKFISAVACWLARPLVSVRDVTSGFFMLKKSVIENMELKPRGFKILLEILVRGRYRQVKEIPFVFADRKRGESKLGLGEFWNYILQLFDLYQIKFPWILEFLKYSFVGLLGFIIHLTALYLLVEIAHLHYLIASSTGFVLAVSSNFMINRFFTFRKFVWKTSLHQKYMVYFSLNLGTLFLNGLLMTIFVGFFHYWYIFSQILVFLIIGTLNYILAKFLVFTG